MTFRPQSTSVFLVFKGINAKTIAATTIATTLPNMRFAVMDVRVEAATLTGAATSMAWQLGTNSATFNNIIASTGFNPASQFVFETRNPASTTISVAPSTAIVFNVTVGTTATTMTVNVFVRGVYF